VTAATGAEGTAVLKLLCPDGHEIARLIPSGATVHVVLPGKALEDWEDHRQQSTFAADCLDCGRTVRESTDVLQARLTEMIKDKWEHEGQYALPFET
jgi:hypothetical protein